MMDIFDFAKQLFLFRGVPSENLGEVLKVSLYETRRFVRGETIYSPHGYEKKIGFVMTGKCEVRRTKPDGSLALLNTLNVYDAFGVLAVFSECEEYPTEIVAAKNSEIMFIPQSGALALIAKYPKISENVIRFLSERIRFLNQKIANFSGTRVENRLASYLLLKSETLGESFSLNCNKAAQAINAGRASVYRALSSLSELGIISYSGDKIIILDPNGLKEISK